MIGVPPLGARVNVWPTPGRLVQMDHRPVDRWAGGRWMPSSGVEVKWGTFQQEQLQAGDLMFHPPACDEHSAAKDKDAKEDAKCSGCGRDMKAHADHSALVSAAKEKIKKPAEAKAASALFDPHAETDAHMKREVKGFENLGKEKKDDKPAAGATTPATKAKE